MMQVRELTPQEKRKAFMKISKKQLAEMLIESNRMINILKKGKIKSYKDAKQVLKKVKEDKL